MDSVTIPMAFIVQISSDMTVGDLVVGAGTLGLALFTGLLAKRTGREVKVSEEQIRLTRESIEAVDRPFIIVSRKDGFIARMAGNVIEFALSNLGKGPGIVDELVLFGSSGDDLLVGGLDESRSLAPENRVPLEMSIGENRIAKGDEVTLRVRYQSASGFSYHTDSYLRLGDRYQFSYHGHRRSYDSAPEDSATGKGS
jgi:hypothetical protein